VSRKEVMELVALQQFGMAQRDNQHLEGDDAILDREALQGGFSGPLEPYSHGVSVPVVQETR
jgi:hypothetical protein